MPPIEQDKDGPGPSSRHTDPNRSPAASSSSATPTPTPTSGSSTSSTGQGFLEQVARWGDEPDRTGLRPHADGSQSSQPGQSSQSGSSVSTQALLGKKGSFSPPPTRPPPGPPPSAPPPLPPMAMAPTTPTRSSSIQPTYAFSQGYGNHAHPFAQPSPNAINTNPGANINTGTGSSPIAKRTVSGPGTPSTSAPQRSTTQPLGRPPPSHSSQAYYPSSSSYAPGTSPSQSRASPPPYQRWAGPGETYRGPPNDNANASAGSIYATKASLALRQSSSPYVSVTTPGGPTTTMTSATFRPSSRTSLNTLPPQSPPPTSALPELPLPSSVTGHRRTTSTSSRTSLGTSQRLSSSPPRVSPRNSSLIGTQGGSTHPFASPAASSSQNTMQAQAQAQNRPKSSRTPSRHLLQTALDLAQRAVEMDKMNDVTGALAAYREAVSRLKSVMARVGVETTEGGKGKKSAGRTEEEGRTLRGIHDAYEARIVLLSSFEDTQMINEEPADEQQREAPRQEEQQRLQEAQRREHEEQGRSQRDLDEAESRRTSQRVQASVSTATLVPAKSGVQQQPRGEDDGTPRPSLDDTGSGIGNFMMTAGDTSSGSAEPAPTSSSGHGSPDDPNITSPFSSRPLSSHTTRTSSLYSSERNSHPVQMYKDDAHQTHPGQVAGSPIQPPPRRTSILASQYAQQGMPTLGSPVSTRTESAQLPSNDTSLRRRTASRPSVGIENEVDIPEEEDQEEGMEVLAKTPGAKVQQHPLVAAQLSPRRDSMPGMGLSMDHDRDRPLPPLPNSAPVLDQGGRVVSGQHLRQASASSGSGRPPSGSFLVNPSTQSATIAQRRTSRGVDGVPSAPNVTTSTRIDGMPGSGQIQQFPFTQQPAPGTSSAASSVHTPRSRTRSQPGSISGRLSTDEVPPLPHTVRHRTSFTSSITGRISSNSHSNSSSSNHASGLRINTDASNNLVPPLPTSSRSSIRSHSTLTRSPSQTLISPVPEPQPPEIVHRSFHLLRLICMSMDPMSSGAYLTASIHISPAVWAPSQWSKANGKIVNPPRIIAQDVKYRVLETMCFHLDLIRKNAKELVDGQRAYRAGGRIPGDQEYVATMRARCEHLGKELARSLGAMDEDMKVGYKSLMKAGVPVGSWKEKGGGKKAGNSMSWSSKLKDRMTNGRTLESPDKYVDLLSQFSFVSQTLNEHLMNFTGMCTAQYAVMPEIQYRQVESRLSNAASFISSALVPFILDDVMQFVSRYMKGGVKYLEE